MASHRFVFPPDARHSNQWHVLAQRDRGVGENYLCKEQVLPISLPVGQQTIKETE